MAAWSTNMNMSMNMNMNMSRNMTLTRSVRHAPLEGEGSLQAVWALRALAPGTASLEAPHLSHRMPTFIILTAVPSSLVSSQFRCTVSSLLKFPDHRPNTMHTLLLL